MRELYVNLSPEAAGLLRANGSRFNANGLLLRTWLMTSFAAIDSSASRPSLFAETLQVDDDVPLLLAALASLTKQSPDEIVEAWVMQPPDLELLGHHQRVADNGPALPEEVMGRIADALDMGETLFEETVSDAKRKLGGSYPDGDKAARTGAEVFRALRRLIGIPITDDGQPADEQTPASEQTQS